MDKAVFLSTYALKFWGRMFLFKLESKLVSYWFKLKKLVVSGCL